MIVGKKVLLLFGAWVAALALVISMIFTAATEANAAGYDRLTCADRGRVAWNIQYLRQDYATIHEFMEFKHYVMIPRERMEMIENVYSMYRRTEDPDVVENNTVITCDMIAAGGETHPNSK